MHKLRSWMHAWNQHDTIVLIVLGASALSTLALYQLTTTTPARGGSYTEGIVGRAETVDPLIAQTETERLLSRIAYPPLSSIADISQELDQEQTWRVVIRPNVPWSTGGMVDAHDIERTITTLRSTTSTAAAWRGVQTEYVDERTLLVHGPRTYGYLGTVLADAQLVAPTSTVTGYGSYKTTSIKRSKEGAITQYRAANIRTGRAAPYIGIITIRIYPNTHEAVRAFNAGALDGIGLSDPDALATVTRSHQRTITWSPSYYGLFINQSNAVPLQHRSVRAALSAALQPSLRASLIAGGRDATIQFGEPLGQEADPIDLLRNAGWRRAEDGHWYQRNRSEPLTVRLTAPTTPFLMRTAEQVVAAWNNIGVVTETTYQSPTELATHTVPRRDYAVLLYGNVLNEQHDLYPFWHTSQRFTPGLNLSIYSNPATDARLRDIRTAREATERQAIARTALNQIVSEQQAAILLYQAPYALVTAPRVENITLSSTSSIPQHLDRITEWYTRTRRVLYVK